MCQKEENLSKQGEIQIDIHFDQNKSLVIDGFGSKNSCFPFHNCPMGNMG
jgi:hypothetical protein